MNMCESMCTNMYGVHTLGVVGAALATGSRIRLVGLADERHAVEVVPPEVLLRDPGNNDNRI